MYALLLGAAILPSVLLLALLYIPSRELSPSLIVGAFMVGALTLAPVYGALELHERVVGDLTLQPWSAGLYRGFVLASLPEELVRVLVVWIYLAWARLRTGLKPHHALTIGAAITLGFASLESAIYVDAQNKIYLESRVWAGLWSRTTTALPLHAGLGVIAGEHVRKALLADAPVRVPWRALLVVVVLHGCYDAPLLIQHALGDAASELEAKLLVAASYVILVIVVGYALWCLARAHRLFTRPAVTGRGKTTSS